MPLVARLAKGHMVARPQSYLISPATQHLDISAGEVVIQKVQVEMASEATKRVQA